MQELGAERKEGRAATIRCGNCGALNPADADWCGQCLRPFAPAPQATRAAPPASSAPPPTTDADPLFAPATPPAPADDTFDSLWDPLGIGFESIEAAQSGEHARAADDAVTDPTNAVPVVRRHGAFAIEGADISWTCDRCDTDNELAARVCRVCGTRFAAAVEPHRHAVARDPNTVALVSLFFPGAGHGYLGMWGQAIARAATTMWVLAVVLVAALQKGVPGSGSIVAIFGATAFALWGLAAQDAYREASNDPRGVILKPRAFLIVTVALLFVLFVSVMVAGINANS